MRLSKWLGALIACASASSVGAQDLNLIDEIRLGGALSNIEYDSFLYQHLYISPDFASFDIAKLDTLQFDVLFRSPDMGALEWLGSPRPTVGGLVNLAGRESYVHAGLNWQLPLGDIVYLEAGGGMALHNGALEGATPPLRNLGCPLLFHWSYGVGANITDSFTVTATFQHISNVIFGCSPNQGLNHFGVSLGYKF